MSWFVAGYHSRLRDGEHLTLNDTFSADGAEGLDAQAARTGAVLDIVDVGLVSVDLARDTAHVNRSAAALLKCAQGFTTASAFSGVIRALARRALDQADVAVALRRLKHDSLAELRTTWLFAEAPTHLGVVSKPAPDIGPDGRIWAFYDNSALAQAIESSSRASDLLRATSDAMLDAQALLEGVWGDGQIVDFVFRDVNPAACEYLGLTEDDLVGRSLLETMPNLGPSGLLAQYAHCAVTGEPLVVDDVLYDNELLNGPRRYDIRGTHVRGDLISLTWRDVTERSELVKRITASEEQFRLLAENVADVVVRLTDDGTITWISNNAEDAMGAPAEFWIGRQRSDFIPAEEHQTASVRWTAVTRTGESFIERARILDANGIPHWVHLHSKPFHDADGNRDGVVTSFRVIDDEVAAEERAQGLLGQRDDQNRALTHSLQSQTERLTAELDSAARYVASILPAHLTGPVEVAARYVPSRELGGDSYDYRWIDDDHLIFYLVDVSGHGVEPAMLSVSVHNLMRSGTFDRTMLLEPDWVLMELNRMFPMEQQYGHFFTIWYGVYQASTRTLRFASAGHPPALALSGGSVAAQLSTPGVPIGVTEDADFTTSSYQVPPGADILLYSDGAFELDLPDGRVWSLPQFVNALAETAASAGWTLDDLIGRLQARSESGMFDDDCTLVRLSFP